MHFGALWSDLCFFETWFLFPRPPQCAPSFALRWVLPRFLAHFHHPRLHSLAYVLSPPGVLLSFCSAVKSHCLLLDLFHLQTPPNQLIGAAIQNTVSLDPALPYWILLCVTYLPN